MILYREVKFPSPTYRPNKATKSSAERSKGNIITRLQITPWPIRHKELFYKLDLHLASRTWNRSEVVMKRTTKQRWLLVCFRTSMKLSMPCRKRLLITVDLHNWDFIHSFNTWTSIFYYGTRALRWLSNDMFLNRSNSSSFGRCRSLPNGGRIFPGSMRRSTTTTATASRRDGSRIRILSSTSHHFTKKSEAYTNLNSEQRDMFDCIIEHNWW